MQTQLLYITVLKNSQLIGCNILSPLATMTWFFLNMVCTFCYVTAENYTLSLWLSVVWLFFLSCAVVFIHSLLLIFKSQRQNHNDFVRHVLLQRRPMASWAALGVLPAQWGRWSSHSTHHWCVPAWSAGSSSGVPSTEKILTHLRESSEGLQR